MSEENFFVNKFLYFQEKNQNDYFYNSLIYIFEHNQQGALGIVMNKVIPISENIIFGNIINPAIPQIKMLENKYFILI